MAHRFLKKIFVRPAVSGFAQRLRHLRSNAHPAHDRYAARLSGGGALHKGLNG